jgi:uncharacterized sulfatase
MKLLTALPLLPLAIATGLAAVPRPNVVFFIVDDQSWMESSAYGGASVPTPQFDRLAREGVLFDHGYTSAPSCAPSRAAVLTGRNFWELEQGAFIQGWLPRKFPLLPDLLEGAGYHAGFTGKGWGPGVDGPGGRERNPAGTAWNTERRKRPEPGINPIDYAANFAKFLDAQPDGKPFYFWVGTTEPHHPHDRRNHEKLGVPLADIRVPGFLPDTPGVRTHRADYLYEVRHADTTLGEILKILDDRGLSSNTIVIATGDNGTPSPRAKADLYDWGVHVPFAVRWPARVAPGRRVADFVNFIDVAPTLLDAAGATIPEGMSGRSFLNVLADPGSGQIDASRTWTATGLEWHGRTLAGRMVRDARHLYVVNYDLPFGPLTNAPRRPDADYAQSAERSDVASLLLDHASHSAVRRFNELINGPRPREELYDCVADPFQLTNLAARAELKPVLERLRATLEGYQRKTGDPRVTGDMEIFNRTRTFVDKRKKADYKDPQPEY